MAEEKLMQNTEQNIGMGKMAVGVGGTAGAKFLALIGLHDWASFAAFLTCVFVLMQIGGWIFDRFFKRRKK